jgi:simple sugar transport system substrate-binding protein
MIKFAFWLAYVVSLALPLATFAQKKPRIVVVTHGAISSPFWMVAKKGAEDAGKATDALVEYRAPEKFDLAAMAQLIDAAVASKPDGLVVSIPDKGAIGSAIQRAVSAGIPVVSMNSGAEYSKQLGCLMHVGQTEELAGREAGVRMKALGARNVIVLNHETGNIGLDQRGRGFVKGFEGPFHQVQVLPVNPDSIECRDAVITYLQKNADIDGIMILGADIAEPTLQALDQTRRPGRTRVATFDLSPAVLQALINKQMDFALDQHQWLQGYLPVLFLANSVKYGSMPRLESIATGPSFVTPENARRVLDLSREGFR